METKPQAVTPIGDRVLCCPSKPIATNVIQIPDAHKEASNIYEVMRLGTKRANDEPFEVDVGENIIVTKFAGVDLNVDGEPCKIVHSDDIIAVYKNI